MVFVGCTSLAFSQDLSFEQEKEGWLLKENGSPRYFYQTVTKDKNGKYPRANYVHPLYGLNGEILTEDFPDDHLHHRGIFWAWHQLWVDDKRIADPWIGEGIEWVVDSVYTETVESQTATLSSRVYWQETAGEQRKIIEENVKIIYERLSNDLYRLEFEISLKPLVENVELGGSEDPKGYGGFSPRIKLSDNVGFFGKGGKVEPQNLALMDGPWINVTQNKENDPGIVIMGIPEQLPSYQGWILRAKDSMQNMAFPGREPLALKEKGLTFNHQLLVHEGLSQEQIDRQYENFISSKSY